MASAPPASRGLLDADMATVGRWLRQGLDWWLGELSAMVPARARRAFSGQSTVVPVAVDGTPADLSGFKGRPVLAFTEEAALVRRVEVGTEAGVSRRMLRAMVEAEAERLLPVPPADLLIASRVVGLRRDDGVADIELAALPLACGERLAGACRAAGIDPGPVTIGDAGLSPGFDFRPAMVARGLLAVPSRKAERWWAGVAILLMFNLALVVWRDVAAVRRLEDRAAAQQPAVAIAQTLQRRIARLDGMAQQAAARRSGNEPVAVLGFLAETLPVGTQLQRFLLDGEEMRLAGYKQREVNLPAALRATGRFAEVRSAGTSGLADLPAGQPFDVQLRLQPARATP